MAVVAGWVGGLLGVLAAVAAPAGVAAPGTVGAVGAVSGPAARTGVAAASRAAPGGTGGTGAPGGPGGRASFAVGFVAVAEVDASIGQEMRYATPHNFTGAVVDGYDEPVCLLARPAAEALRRAQREVLRRGYSLLVHDCYRPQRAVDRFVRWARDGADQSTKAEFYPGVAKDRLIPEGYIAERSGHSRGSTVDVTLAELGRGRSTWGLPSTSSTRSRTPTALG